MRAPSPSSTDAARRRVDVGRGLHVLRYASATDTAVPPVFEVTVAEDQRSNIGLVAYPGERTGLLQLPGDFLVVRAMERGFLNVLARPRVRNGSIAAELRLENLEKSSQGSGRNQDAPPIENPPVRASARPITPPQLRVLGHVSRLGDVVVGNGDWLGGPEMPHTIEGVSVSWLNSPPGTFLEVSAELGGRARRPAPQDEIGFVGTRGRALPIVGLTFLLTGDAADAFYVSADALFLGSRVVSNSGRKISFSGPSGTEPLIGLRLTVEDRRLHVTGSSSGRLDIAGSPGRDERNRVRVFRRPGSSAGI